MNLDPMCGRFSLTASPQEVKELFGLVEIEDFPPRYNIAPTQPVLVITPAPAPPQGSNQPDRKASIVRWGLLPSWVKDPRDFPLLINARSETAATKNAFRGAMRHRRALLPATGFYEWKRAEKGKSQPYLIRSRNRKPFAFAALTESWMGADGSEIDTAAILTTAANEKLKHIHHRVPVVIGNEHFNEWLDCRTYSPEDVARLLAPPPEDFFEAVAISDKVNKVANTGPDIQEPLESQAEESPGGSDGGGQFTLL